MSRPATSAGCCRILAALTLAAGLCVPALADASAPSRPGLEELVVVAQPLPTPVRDVPAGIDILAADNPLGRVSQDLETALRHLTGASVEGNGTRFAPSGVSIRGMGGNRVLVLLEGVPLSDSYAVGAYSASSNQWFAPGLVQRVELLKGPASTQFGSDALGGVLATRLLAAEDLLAQGSGPLAGRVGSRHDSSRNATTSTAALAMTGAGTDLLFAASVGKGHGADHSAASAFEDDQDWLRRDLLLRAGTEVGSSTRLELLVLDQSLDSSSSQQSLPGWGRRFARTTALDGDDREDRHLVQAQVSLAPGAAWLERGSLRLWQLGSRTRQRTDELRVSPDQAILRRFHLQRGRWGFNADAELTLGADDKHALGWGLAASTGWVREHRDGQITDLSSGVVSKNLLGEVMPVRDFPETRSTHLAAYLHDVIQLGQVFGRDLALVPGVRWQQTSINAHQDPVWADDYSADVLRRHRAAAWSPRVGLRWQLASDSDFFALLASGFRAPPAEELNLGFEIPRFNYRALPNPDLQPERSTGLELGFRHRGRDGHFEATLFGTRYQDLIESRALVARTDDGGLVFQSRNLDRARIVGVEFRSELDLRRLHPVLAAWRLALDGTWLRGDDLRQNQPLDSIPPPELHLALGWHPTSQPFEAAVHMQAARGKRRLAASDGFESPGRAVFDLTVRWQPLPGLTLDLLARNLFDRTWWAWPAVAGRAPDDPMLPLLSGAGRGLAIAFTYDFAE